jgi:hypothetical protein
MAESQPNLPKRTIAILGIVCVILAGLFFGIAQIRKLTELNRDKRQSEFRQLFFDKVKQGDSSAVVIDSQLLPMLANDSQCQQVVTALEFAEINIESVDAPYVAQLKNVTRMSFYCTTGTKELLMHARSLPITELYFEMPDLLDEDYLILKDFPHLQKVHFEHVMEDEWIDRLKSKLPNVEVAAPFPLSKEPQ